MKQLIQECEAMGIAIRLITEENSINIPLEIKNKNRNVIDVTHVKEKNKKIDLSNLNFTLEKKKETKQSPKKQNYFEENFGKQLTLDEMKTFLTYLIDMNLEELDKLIEPLYDNTFYIKKIDSNKFIMNINDDSHL